jgi:transposase
MGYTGFTDDELEARIAVYRAANRNVSETARQLEKSRHTVRNMLMRAAERGMLEEWEIKDPTVPTRDAYLDARTRKIALFQKKQRKGDWRKPVMTQLPARPFRLKIFGDPHLDADGCNFELFERHWLDMDASKGVYGICVGDWFNNWLRALAHLWKGEGDPSDAWLCLEYLMEQRGDALIAACSGNHDDWTHGPADPVDLLMKKYGVIYRTGAVRVALGFGEDMGPIFMAIRHKWRGHSMYSAAHGILRAGLWGWRDHLMVGGHIHQDEPRMLSFPDGFRAHVCQVSAFKQYDDFKDVHGFQGPVISPCWELVIDPRRADSDPEKIKIFWDMDAAQGYLDYLRSI